MMNIKPTGFVIRFIISLFLLVSVGIDNAVAQSFPVEGKIYTIKARFTNGSGDLYLTNSSSTLTFPKTIEEDGSYWKAVSTGNSSYPWSFQSIADPTKYLNGDMSSGISTTRMNFAVNVCNSVAGTYHLWASLGGGTGDRNVSTWASNSGKSGFGKSGSGGCFGSGHNNTDWSTDYVITEYTPTPMGDNVSLSFVDASDNAIAGASVNYRAGGSTISLTPADGTYNFGDEGFFKSLFSSALSEYELTDVVFDPIGHTIKFVLVKDPNILTLSDAPSATAWAANTTWFTIRNNRNAKGYLSTQDSGQYLDAQSNLTVKNGTDASGDRGGLWAFVQNGDGINIYNNAYGPDFILGVTGSNGNARLQMYPKDDIPAGVTTLFAYGENSQKDGASHAYYFQVGTSGNNHLNEQSGYPALWNHANKISDAGSAFKVTMVSNDEVNALPEYDVYKTACKGTTESFDISYINTSNSFGKRDKANDGSYLILAHGSATSSDQFSLSTTDYSIISTSVDADSNHAYSILNITLRDVFATEEWTVVTSDGSSVNFVGVEYNNGESFFVRPGMTPKHIDFSINAPSDKFVWGPTFDKANKIVNYDVRERATTLESGWYQLQLVTESAVNTINALIKPEEGNPNTQSHTIYSLPAIYSVGNATMKYSGVPTYTDEVGTYVYIDKLNQSGNWLTVQVPNGKYVDASSGFNISRAPSAEPQSINYQFVDGLLQMRGWNYQSTSPHPMEGPLQIYASAADFSNALSFNICKADVSQYKIYKVVFDGEGKNLAKEVTLNNLSAKGNNVVGNNGYLFLPVVANAPVMRQFSVTEGSATIFNMDIEDIDGTTTITLYMEAKTENWIAKITGDAKTSADRIIYNNVPYVDGALMPMTEGRIPVHTDFKTNVTDRFVWGPIIDAEARSITFDIRPVPNTLETGWYQMMLIEDPSNGDAQKRATAASVNSRIASNSGNINTQSNYIYVMPMFNNTTTTLAKYGGIPTYADEASTYFYITNNGSNINIQTPDGRYLRNGSAESGQTTAQAITNRIFGEGKLALGGLVAPGYWSGSGVGGNAGNQGPIVATGAAGTYYENHYITKIDVDSKYDVYKVDLSSTSQSTVNYIGNDNHGVSLLYNNGYIFITKGETPLATDFKFAGSTKINSIDITSNVITFNVTSPTYSGEIIHQQGKYYDRLETESNLPEEGFVRKGDGWIESQKSGVYVQNTAEYTIPVYLKIGGNSYTGYMPSDQIRAYQRWYNYDTEDVSGLTTYLSNFTGGSAWSKRDFSNGYVTGGSYNGGGYRSNPTFVLPAGTPDYFRYNVAMDFSRFGDGQANAGNNCMLEPTLSMRVIYQLGDAKIVAKAMKDATTAGKFYETHNISFPNIKHGRNEDKTGADIVPLDMDLNNYWMFEGGTETDAALRQLTADNQIVVECVNNTAGIRNCALINGTGGISRTNFNQGHFITFQYPEGGIVDVNSSATINVYMRKDGSSPEKVNLAQFNLTFVGNSEPKILSEVVGRNADGTFKSERSSEAMQEYFGSPVAKLSFDNYPVVGTSGQYFYPLNFSGASYAYGDGTGNGTARGEYSLRHEGGLSAGGSYNYYPIQTYYNNINNPGSASTVNEDGNYFLYIDAADQPGKIMSIELNDQLCVGSRLYCYGWIGCTSGGTSALGMHDQNPASVILNIVGYDEDDNEHILSSYCPGMISSRGYDANGRPVHALAYGRTPAYENYNIREQYYATWQQIGFSFLIDTDAATHMKRYAVQVTNNCYNSNGGDVVLDNFEIFVKKPGAEVQLTTPLCSDQIRHIKVIADYQSLIDATGEDSDHDGLMNVGFCFLDKDAYDQALATYASNISLPANDPENAYNKAFGEALIGERTIDNSRKDHAFHNFNIIRDGLVSTIGGVTKVRTYEDDIPKYSFKESQDDKVYRDSIRGDRYVVFKESVAHGESSDTHQWVAGKSYYLLFSTATITEEHVNNHDLACTVFGLNDNKCSVLYEFTVTPPVTIKGDVEEILSSDEVNACEGQTTTLSVNLNGRKETEDVVIKNLTYDWWVGNTGTTIGDIVGEGTGITYNTSPATLNDYMSRNFGTYTANNRHIDTLTVGKKVYLHDALLELRRAYPNVSSLDGVTPKHVTGDTEEYDLTQEMIDCVSHFLQPDGNGDIPLVLYQKQMNLNLTRDKADENRIVHFVVLPIPPGIYDVDEDAIYCPDPHELKIYLTSKSPVMTNGFQGKTYPTSMESVPVRIGLSQIDAVRKIGAAQDPSEQRTLRIPLRGINFAYTWGTKLQLPYPGAKIYITNTNDPAYLETEGGLQTGQGSSMLPSDDDISSVLVEAGEISTLEVERGHESEAYVNIIFDRNIRMREGFIYTFKINYVEMMPDAERDENGLLVLDGGGNPIYTGSGNLMRTDACTGSFVFDMKIVPEYQVWTGTVNNDWSNDANWRRADRSDLNANDAKAADAYKSIGTPLHNYVGNATNETSNSFVPMYFTNVLLDKNDAVKPELYDASVLALDGFITLNSTATSLIQYDLETKPMVDGGGVETGNYECEIFGTNIARGVTFTPGGMLYNAHLLNYKKAWVEYEINAGEWYTLASPLQGMVAGEWYAPTAGAKQMTPHFYGITYDENLNDRFRPAFYQRSWNKATANVYHILDDGNYSGAQPENVAIQGNWSNVYNDVDVKYGTGEGFSVKVDYSHMNPSDRPADGKALVRLPKDDASYFYYDIEGEKHNNDLKGENVDRSKSGRLMSDLLNEAGHVINQTITNVDAANNIFLVSNPFMAPLDIDQFFAVNTQFEKKYWLVNANNQMMSVKDDTGWVDVSGGSAGSIAPLQSFFVRSTTETATTAIMFNEGMQYHEALPGATRSIVRLTAKNQNTESSAAVLYSNNVNDKYAAYEGCQTFIDNLNPNAPIVYTTTSGMALSINQTSFDSVIPIGMLNITEDMELTIDGENLPEDISLFDAVDNEYYPIGDDILTITIGKDSSRGRYFITRSDAHIDELPTESSDVDVICTKNGNMLSFISNAEIAQVNICDLSGRTIYSRKNSSNICNVSTDKLQGTSSVILAKIVTDKGTKSIKIAYNDIP